MNRPHAWFFHASGILTSHGLRSSWGWISPLGFLAALFACNSPGHVLAAPAPAEDKPAEVTIRLVTEGDVHPDGAVVFTLVAKGGWFLDTEGRGYTERNFADIVRIPANVTGPKYVVIQLEDQKIPFDKVTKVLDKLRRLAEPNSQVVILVYYEPPGK